MAVDDPSDPLDRATAAARSDDPPGWAQISQSVVQKLRSLVIPAPTVLTFDASGTAQRGAHGSTVRVSTRILVPHLRSVVDTATRAADSIDVTVTDDRCAWVHVGLVCTYGSDLNAEGEAVRVAVAAALRDVVGPDPDFDPQRDVEIEIVDVVEGDPHRE